LQILLAIFYFFYFAIIGVYVIFIPKVLEMSGYSASEIGIIFAAGPFVRFLLPFAFTRGLKIDIKSFNFALFLMVVGSAGFYLSIDSFYKLLISNIVLGVGLSLVLPYVEVIALSSVTKDRYGRIRLFGSIGFVLVALVLVKFLSSAEIALNYLLISVFCTVVISYIIAKKTRVDARKDGDVVNDINLLSDYKLWLGLTLMQVSFGSFYNFFTIYETGYGISLDMTIYLWGFGVFAEIVMLYFQARFLRNNLLVVLQITTFASAFRWFLLFIFPQNITILFFAQSLHALSFALFHSASISYLYHFYKHKALAQQFFSGITYGLGGFTGAMLAGFIYEHYPTYLFLSSTLLALGAFLSLTMWRKQLD